MGNSSWLILQNKTRSTGEPTPLLLGLRIHTARLVSCPGGFLRRLPPTFNAGRVPAARPVSSQQRPPGEPTTTHAQGLAQPHPPKLVRPRATSTPDPRALWAHPSGVPVTRPVATAPHAMGISAIDGACYVTSRVEASPRVSSAAFATPQRHRPRRLHPQMRGRDSAG